MSSRFISGGTNEAPTERDEAWLAAQAQIDARHLAKAQSKAQAESGKSLYEVLQANKAAKQDAFEESIKLRHQFQNLDEDDVEFLDSVRQTQLEAENEARRETRRQIDEFRRNQQAILSSTESTTTTADPAGSGGQDEVKETGTVEEWTVQARKRKKAAEKNLGGIKLRKTSIADRESARDTTIVEYKLGVEVPKSDQKAGSTDPVKDGVRTGGVTEKPDSSATSSKGNDGESRSRKDQSPQPAQAKKDLVPVASNAISARKSGLLGIISYSDDEDE